MRKSSFQSGLSMIELLTVVSIIALLVILAITQLPQQVTKARDGRRKSDLQKIKIAFENYYSDNDCYPDPDILDNCGGSDLSPYLASIPCDPQTGEKYLYAPEEGTSCPGHYRVYADLEVDTDPVIAELGCNVAGGCGAYTFFGTDPEIGSDAYAYNYGVSEGVPVLVTEGNTPPLTSGWCCANGNCDSWNQNTGICSSGIIFPDYATCNTSCN